jgi:hypothetical protein
MASDRPESGGFLALIDAKIAALQQLRESLLYAISIGALGQATDLDPSLLQAGSTSLNGAAGAARGPIELPTGVFRGKGLSDAIRLYLSMAKRKQTNQEIKNALMGGGLATTSDFFDQTLSSTLHRMRKSGELLQFKDGWDLAASYPDSFRRRMTEGKEPTPKTSAKNKGRKKGKGGKKAASSAKPNAPATAAEPTNADDTKAAA